MFRWARDSASRGSPESFDRLIRIQKNERLLDNAVELRDCLLDFIADFASWDNAMDPAYLEAARALTQAAHEALGGAQGTRPLVVDPFAGGGSIPLEALRVGTDAFASDLNPVAVLLNKLVIEYIPQYREQLAEEVQRLGTWVRTEAEKELAEFYPSDSAGSSPFTYLWARTIRCEGSGCGAEVPLIRSAWLAKKPRQAVSLQIGADKASKRVTTKIVHGKPPDGGRGTTRLGSVTCPVCDYTTPVTRVREQLRLRRGGAADARLLCVVETTERVGRLFREPSAKDIAGVERAKEAFARLLRDQGSGLSLIPNEPTPTDGTGSKGGGYRTRKYGYETYADFFSPRQLLALATLLRLIRTATDRLPTATPELRKAVATVLATAFDRVLVRCTANCIWDATTLCIMQVFNQGQSLPFRPEFAEMVPIADEGSGLATCLEYAQKAILSNVSIERPGSTHEADAARIPLPDDSCQAFITDPPYYDSVPYAELSDFFYVWLRRLVPELESRAPLTPKDEECIVDLLRNKSAAFFEAKTREALAEGRRVLSPTGVGVVVFAHKSTAGWESVLQALVDSGWIVTASWPIDTESENRLRAKNSAALASSVHLVCRPRENSDGSLRSEVVGDWRDILAELPRRIHEWMPRLAAEGVVGADAIFACLGPALEVFSRHSSVEKASGEKVALKEYLEHVWAAVAKEALSMIFAGAETTGFEEDARLTAMWLWTLSAGGGNGKAESTRADDADEPEDDEDDAKGGKKTKVAGFALEYDAARKIAQGLGAHLEDLRSLVELKGETARLLPVAERTRALFGKSDAEAPTARRKKKAQQMNLGFAQELEEAEETGGWGQKGAPKLGQTVLDRVHQSMILFAAGRGEALRRFLIDEGAGRDGRFWRLAQALAALYPAGTEERRWVEGVLARKRGLGF
jgi:adenine-specific DNA methylase